MSTSVGDRAPDPSVWTVVVAGGSGARFGGPKQFEPVAGRRVIDWATAAASEVGSVVAVVPAGAVRSPAPTGADLVVAGGPTRADSVRHGLDAVPDDATIVLVHDAARPLATPPLFERVVAAVAGGADAVVPVVPVVDTLRRRPAEPDAGVAGAPFDRESVVAVQTPQGFRAAVLRRAHHRRGSAEVPTDDASLVEAHGAVVTTVEGDPSNIKITTPTDLRFAGAVLSGSA